MTAVGWIMLHARKTCRLRHHYFWWVSDIDCLFRAGVMRVVVKVWPVHFYKKLKVYVKRHRPCLFTYIGKTFKILFMHFTSNYQILRLRYMLNYSRTYILWREYKYASGNIIWSSNLKTPCSNRILHFLSLQFIVSVHVNILLLLIILLKIWK